MGDSDQLKQLYKDALAKGPFPTEQCGRAGITAAVHGELILYLAEIAGLASRGERGLAALSESEKAKFHKLASSGISTRVAGRCDANHYSGDPRNPCANRSDGTSKNTHLEGSGISSVVISP